MPTTLTALNEQITEAFNGFQAQDATTIEASFEQIAAMYTALADGVRTFSGRIAEGPIDPAVSDHLNDLANTTSQLSDVATAGAQILNNAHPEQMNAVHEKPPGYSETWDLQNQEG